MDPIWEWIVLIILLISTFGTLLPVVPGLPVAAAAVVIYGWLEGFRKVDAALILVTIFLTVAGTLLDYISGPYTVKKYGGSKRGIWGGIIGGVLGLVFWGPLGLIAGPLAGAVLGELLAGKGFPEAARIGVVSLAGIMAGNALKFLFGIVITVYFYLKIF
jgi:uncharacterized protein YqgC (DUF456 family)